MPRLLLAIALAASVCCSQTTPTYAEKLGWSKSDRALRQVKLRGLNRVDWFHRLTMAAYNLTRMSRLIPVPAAAI